MRLNIVLLNSRVFLFALSVAGLVAADINTLLISARSAEKQGNVANAQSAFDSALELAMAEPDQRLTATAGEVSGFYLRQKDLEKAEAVLKRAIDQEESAHSAPINEASLFLNAANLYSQQQRWTDMAIAQERLVQVWEASAGTGSAVVANALYHLAATQQRAGNSIAAEQSIQRSVAILEMIYGPEAPATGHALGFLAVVEASLGNTDAFRTARARTDAINQKLASNAERVGKTVTAPRVTAKQDPAYSEEARKARIQGSVQLSLIVDESGNPQHVTVVLPLGAGLDEAAVETVQKWHFQPGMKDGAPVPVQATIEINFRLL
jgi:TonB family protein